MKTKRVVCTIEMLTDVVKKLREQEYNRMKIYFSGHVVHDNEGLTADRILIHANKYSPRPDLKGRKIIVVDKKSTLDTIENKDGDTPINDKPN